MSGGKLQCVDHVNHLGHIILSVIYDADDAVATRYRKFYSSLFSILSTVKGIGSNPTVWKKIMDLVLLPILDVNHGTSSQKESLKNYTAREKRFSKRDKTSYQLFIEEYIWTRL